MSVPWLGVQGSLKFQRLPVRAECVMAVGTCLLEHPGRTNLLIHIAGNAELSLHEHLSYLDHQTLPMLPGRERGSI
jgi:hypothetical protein